MKEKNYHFNMHAIMCAILLCSYIGTVMNLVNANTPRNKRQQRDATKRQNIRESSKFVKLLSKNETELLSFVVKIDKLYKEVLKKPAPFMTYVLIGMQSSGKSTFMERLLNSVINIVNEGTATRCPLDVTCIHDENYVNPLGDLSGDALDNPGTQLSTNEIFERILDHTKSLEEEEKFDTESLKLVYRAKNVQNMRFVDTPGIISNKGVGNDNREAIKEILIKEINRPNTKICVFLEATEYDKNPIINFLDENLGERSKWIHTAIFVMPKFDKQMEDSRTADKANSFFHKFIENGIFPHLIVTPTLEKENLPAAELFVKRNELLEGSNTHENREFKNWLQRHELFRESDVNNEYLHEKIQESIGFLITQEFMRKQMLDHTLKTIPAVIASLQKDLSKKELRLQDLYEMQSFASPDKLKIITKDMLYQIQQRIAAYMDGDAFYSIKFDENLQTLDDEIEGEEYSYWSKQMLNFHSEKEDKWRNHIVEIEKYPDYIQPENRFLGGKQVQRAIEFFVIILIDSLPDPSTFKELVTNAAGYSIGGIIRENWEGATKQICMTVMQDFAQPGINFLVKHIGYIFRRLLHVALEDIKDGEEFGKTFRLVPDTVESFIVTEFDIMLWDLMTKAADNMHTSLKPFYSTIDPALVSNKNNFKNMDQMGAKDLLKKVNQERVETKIGFLHDKRTCMINDEETEKILLSSFQYLAALIEFSLTMLRVQVNFFLYESLKQEMQKSFIHKASEANWEELVVNDPSISEEIEQIELGIRSIKETLQDVQRYHKIM